MRNYDRSQPLIFLHIPKTAGMSVRTVFQKWYGDRLFEHYFNERKGAMPPRRNLASLHSTRRPVVVYGHFNRSRGFGVQDYYPAVTQFVTILRDPFDMAISSYYYLRKKGGKWRDRSRVPRADLRSYLQATPPNMLNQFPCELTRDNYREVIDKLFIAIGLTERLAESLRHIAKRLDMPFREDWLPHMNAVARDQDDPVELREEFSLRYPLEFEVYEYAAARFPHERP